jgi:hypothetical protein
MTGRVSGRQPPDIDKRPAATWGAHQSTTSASVEHDGDHVTIHRSRHAQQFTVVPNAAAQDTSLSLAARGLLLELLSRPPTWHISADDLARHEQESRERVRRALRELQTAGYAVLHTGRGADGRSWSRWEIFDVPQPPGAGNPAAGPTCDDDMFPQVAPDAGKPAAGNPAAKVSTRPKDTLRATPYDALRAAVPDATEREIAYAVKTIEDRHARGEIGTVAGWLRTIVAKGDAPALVADICRDLAPVVELPDWCGRCDQATRLIGDDTPRRCPRCHPLRAAS